MHLLSVRAFRWVFEAGNRRSSPPRLTAMRASAVALALMLSGLTWLEWHHISATLPYPQATDEAVLSGSAWRILRTGSLHPDSFNYPSLPKYLTAAAMAAGIVRASTALELRSVSDVGNVGYPYYDARRPIETARRTFVLTSILTLIMTAACAWVLTGRAAAIVLAPALAAATPLFFFQSWAYLNVDIVGTCFVVATLWACLKGTQAPSLHRSALTPGILAGLAAGSKYTLAMVFAPVLLAIWFYVDRRLRLRASIVALAAMAGAFLLVSPYIVVDLRGFLDGLVFEGYHYANGHPGAEDTPGLSQLLSYLRHFVSDFGIAAAAFAVIGTVMYTVRDPRRSVILLGFPVATLYFLSQHRVYFPRNVVSLHPILALFSAMGVLVVHGWIVAVIRRTTRHSGSVARALVAVPLLLLALPISHVRDLFRDRTDSRNAAVEWMTRAIAPSWTIVVPKELAMDLRPMLGTAQRAPGPYGGANPELRPARGTGHKIVVVELAAGRTDAAAVELLAAIEMPSVILVPQWGADPWWPGSNRAGELQAVARRWRGVKRFGTEAVITNHENPAPWGNPAFDVAPLKLPQEWVGWLAEFDSRYAVK